MWGWAAGGFISNEPWNRSSRHVWNVHVRSNRNLFGADRGRQRRRWSCVCLWKWSQRAAVFKHERASDSWGDDTSSLIITTGYSNSLVGLKSSSSVTLDLIKCCVQRWPGFVIIPLDRAPRWDPEWFGLVQWTTRVRQQEITFNTSLMKLHFSLLWVFFFYFSTTQWFLPRREKQGSTENFYFSSSTRYWNNCDGRLIKEMTAQMCQRSLSHISCCLLIFIQL